MFLWTTIAKLRTALALFDFNNYKLVDIIIWLKLQK
jgi:hypothetical protein